MTDADVDGAHIRTLLLTFFFRYMKPLIDSGYLYIAQPPLYKAKIGKRESYLKDDKAFKDFVFDWAAESTMLFADNKELGGDAWQKILTALSKYDDRLDLVSRDFKIMFDHIHNLALFSQAHPWKQDDGIDILLQNLRGWFKKYTIQLKREELGPDVIEGDTPTPVPTKQVISFKALTKQWDVDADFFTSAELSQVLTALEPLAVLEKNTWRLQVIDKEKSIEGKGSLNLLRAIMNLSKQYMTVQRYKGLGEMNPEQLWETAMDEKTRILLKVNIEDELEADSWFATLMGDDVQGRKLFIEDNGQFVKNLDI